MDQSEFNQNVLEELHAIASVINKLTNNEYCLRALCFALAEQDGLDRRKLGDDFEDNLQRIQEQVPPDQQNPALYQGFRDALRDRLNRP